RAHARQRLAAPSADVANALVDELRGGCRSGVGSRGGLRSGVWRACFHRSGSPGLDDCTGRAWKCSMLFLVVLLLVLWALGLVTSYTLGGALHVLLVIAIVLFLVHIIQGSSVGEA